MGFRLSTIRFLCLSLFVSLLAHQAIAQEKSQPEVGTENHSLAACKDFTDILNVLDAELTQASVGVQELKNVAGTQDQVYRTDRAGLDLNIQRTYLDILRTTIEPSCPNIIKKFGKATDRMEALMTLDAYFSSSAHSNREVAKDMRAVKSHEARITVKVLDIENAIDTRIADYFEGLWDAIDVARASAKAAQ